MVRAKDRANQTVAESMRQRTVREQGYREKALRMYPHICGRCGREFSGKALKELTVHHRDHDHDNNPEDGSNWELLCLYCHDNEHQRQLEAQNSSSASEDKQNLASTHNPFSDLKTLLEKSSS